LAKQPGAGASEITAWLKKQHGALNVAPTREFGLRVCVLAEKDSYPSDLDQDDSSTSELPDEVCPGSHAPTGPGFEIFQGANSVLT
jgi:hypothetical protein